MISIEELKRCEHYNIYGNKHFGCYWFVKNGVSELVSIRLFSKIFVLPYKLRKLTRNKEKI